MAKVLITIIIWFAIDYLLHNIVFPGIYNPKKQNKIVEVTSGNLLFLNKFVKNPPVQKMIHGLFIHIKKQQNTIISNGIFRILK